MAFPRKPAQPPTYTEQYFVLPRPKRLSTRIGRALTPVIAVVLLLGALAIIAAKAI